MIWLEVELGVTVGLGVAVGLELDVAVGLELGVALGLVVAFPWSAATIRYVDVADGVDDAGRFGFAGVKRRYVDVGVGVAVGLM